MIRTRRTKAEIADMREAFHAFAAEQQPVTVRHEPQGSWNRNRDEYVDAKPFR